LSNMDLQRAGGLNKSAKVVLGCRLDHQHNTVTDRKHKPHPVLLPRSKFEKRFRAYAFLGMWQLIQHVAMKETVVDDRQSSCTQYRLKDLKILGVSFLITIDEYDVKKLILGQVLYDFECVSLEERDLVPKSVIRKVPPSNRGEFVEFFHRNHPSV